jgi:hypothetical protein
MNSIAAMVASPRAIGFNVRPSSSMIAERGTTTVQCRLSTSEVTIERDERRMFVLRKRIV